LFNIYSNICANFSLGFSLNGNKNYLTNCVHFTKAKTGSGSATGGAHFLLEAGAQEISPPLPHRCPFDFHLWTA
jgi:hypothetical protein